MPSSGMVEVRRNGLWGRVADCGPAVWEGASTTVACRSPGYGGGRATHYPEPADGFPVQMSIACAGTEASLAECPADLLSAPSHRGGVGTITAPRCFLRVWSARSQPVTLSQTCCSPATCGDENYTNPLRSSFLPSV